MHQNRDAVEFDHLEWILAGVAPKLNVGGSRSGRAAKAMFETHMRDRYEHAGCFAYVGWAKRDGLHIPSSDLQQKIYAIYARAAVAAKVYLGAMEPNEGFGLAAWVDKCGGSLEASVASVPIQAMLTTASLAADLLAKEVSNEKLRTTRMVLGYGTLRGKALLSAPSHMMLLAGPVCVESLYGEIPNRCGGIAKGKDTIANRVFKDADLLNPTEAVIVYWQPWSRLTYKRNQLLPPTSSDVASTSGKNPAIPDELLEIYPTKPREIRGNENKPYLIALSLDFAQSRAEYKSNAHLARTVVDQILVAFDDLAKRSVGMFVSPRYGDGVSAVIVVEAPSESDALNIEWLASIKGFRDFATALLRNCKGLGLRIGMAADLDVVACAPRLAGVAQTSSPAVDTLANKVITRARQCHDAAKHHKLTAEREAKLFFKRATHTKYQVEEIR